MKILIKNGHVIDPDTKLDQVADVLLEDNKIQEVKENIKDKADRVIDARGCYVMPGLIDMHVHLLFSVSRTVFSFLVSHCS